jgi:hypothetical protein
MLNHLWLFNESESRSCWNRPCGERQNGKERKRQHSLFIDFSLR